MSGGYENAASTQLLAQACIFCGRPLRDPESIERGYGPDCAEKYWRIHGEPPETVDTAAAQVAMRMAPEPLKTRWREIGGDPEDMNAAWATSALARKQMLSVGLHHGALAVTYGGDQLKTVAERVDAALLVIAAVQNFALASGYDRTAAQMQKRYTERLEGQLILFVRDKQKPSVMGVHTPYSEQWARVARENKAIFFRYEKKGWLFIRYFHEAKLGRVVNMLQGVFGDQLAMMDDGRLVALPAMPLPEPVPETPPAGPPTRQTSELPHVPEQAEAIRVGDKVKLPDGTTSTVWWLSPDKGRVGVGPNKRAKYTFLSFADVRTESGKMVAAAMEAERRAGDRAEGITPPTAVEPVRLPREIPAGLMPHQLENIAFAEAHHRVLIADEMGLGKEQWVEEPVLTPAGWKRIGDVKVGDAVVDPATGGSALVTGVFPQGVKRLFRVTMSDGTSTVAGLEHRWLVKERNDRARGEPFRRVLTTVELLEKGLRTPTNARGDDCRKWYLPLTAPVRYADEATELPVHPYVLGVFIGDGCFRHGTVSLSNPDEPIVERVRSLLPEGTSLVQHPADGRCPEFGWHGGIGYVRALGLAEHLSVEKFVPRQYMTASPAERRELVRGLMDTDGDCCQPSCPIFNTSSERLRDDMVELVRGLGGIATVISKPEPAFMHNGERRIGHASWRVVVRLPENPFYLERKASKWRRPVLARMFESIVEEREAEAVCISVASQQSTYLTRDFIVTHNTLSAIAAMDTPVIVVPPSHLKVNWVREISMWRPKLKSTMLEGLDAPSPTQSAADVVIVNYDILHAHVEWLVKFGAQTLIADEAHYLKNLEARWNKASGKHEVTEKSPRRAKAFYELQLGVPKLILLTGTPLMNRTKEIWPLLHMMNAQEWSSHYAFCLRYCGGHEQQIRGRKVFNCDGSTNKQELHQRIVKRYMIRHTKEEVLKDLPPKRRSTQVVSMDPKWRKHYAWIVKDFLSWVQANGGIERVMRAMRAQAIVKLTAMRSVAARGKVPAAFDWISSHIESTGRPLVFMAVHKKAIEDLIALVEKSNTEWHETMARGDTPDTSKPIRYAAVYGGVTKKQAQKAIDDFQVKGTLDLLIYSIPMATGTTLTRAQEVTFLERLWRPSDQVQAEDRAHRIGQQNAVQITYLDAEGTIDRKLALLLMDKATTAAGVIDGIDLSRDDASKLIMGEMFDVRDGFIESLGELLEESELAFVDNEAEEPESEDEPDEDELNENPSSSGIVPRDSWDQPL